MQVTTSGRFPIVRLGEHPLRAAVEAWRARGETTPEAAVEDRDLQAAQSVATRDLVVDQEAAGVDVLGEGYVPIYDECFAWAASVGGVSVENPIRYLDTNTYYHRWRIAERPWRRAPGPLVAAYERAAALTDRPIKPCLIGPYTVWAYANRLGEGDSQAAFDALVDVWAAEVADLTSAGARWVQLDESVLLRPKHRRDMPLVARAVERIARAAPKATLILHLACGAVGDLLRPLLGVSGLGGLGLDFTDAYRAANLEALADWQDGPLLQAGVVDARQVRVETQDEIWSTLNNITRHVPAERCLAAPSTALLYLPYHFAFEKLSTLARSAHGFEPNA